MRRAGKAAHTGIFRWAIFLRVNITSEVITRSLPLPDPRRATDSPSQGIAVSKNYWPISGWLLFLFFLFCSFVFWGGRGGSSFRLELRAKVSTALSTRLFRMRLGEKRIPDPDTPSGPLFLYAFSSFTSQVPFEFRPFR